LRKAIFGHISHHDKAPLYTAILVKWILVKSKYQCLIIHHTHLI